MDQLLWAITLALMIASTVGYRLGYGACERENRDGSTGP